MPSIIFYRLKGYLLYFLYSLNYKKLVTKKILEALFK